MPESPPPAPYEPWVFIVIEIAYLVVFAIVAAVLRKYNFMKTEDDAVTSHHRRHYQLVEQQQEELLKKQKQSENFLVAEQS